MSARSVQLDDLVAVLGRDDALKLCRDCGGRRFYLPKSDAGSPPEQIVDAIGIEAAQALEQAYRSTYIVIPLANREVAIWLARKGYEPGEIAGRLRVTERAVERWIS